MKLKYILVGFCLVLAVGLFTGCIRDSGESSQEGLVSENSDSAQADSQVDGLDDETASGIQSKAESSNTSEKTTSTVSTTGSSDSEYEDLLDQLDELEKVLNSLDDGLDLNLDIPNP